jgi:hypothetical protein
MKTIWAACVIMHNMIIEDERDDNDLNQSYLFSDEPFYVAPEAGDPRDDNLTLNTLIQKTKIIQNAKHHFELRDSLIQHV